MLNHLHCAQFTTLFYVHRNCGKRIKFVTKTRSNGSSIPTLAFGCKPAPSYITGQCPCQSGLYDREGMMSRRKTFFLMVRNRKDRLVRLSTRSLILGWRDVAWFAIYYPLCHFAPGLRPLQTTFFMGKQDGK